MSEMEIKNEVAIEADDVKVTVFKHKLSSRIMHGCVALGFCLCLITGILLVFGVNISRDVMALIHVLAAVLLIVAPTVYLFVNWKSFARFMGTVTHYDKDDWGWVKAPMGGYLDPYLFRGKPEHYVPPQEKYNTGQKGAGVCLALGAVVLAITGILMWANTPNGILTFIHIDLTPGMTWFIWRLHLVTAVCTALVFAVHFFLGAIYPVTNVEFFTMFGNGVADYGYTKKKHGKWLESLELKEEKTCTDDEAFAKYKEARKAYDEAHKSTAVAPEEK